MNKIYYKSSYAAHIKEFDCRPSIERYIINSTDSHTGDNGISHYASCLNRLNSNNHSEEVEPHFITMLKMSQSHGNAYSKRKHPKVSNVLCLETIKSIANCFSSSIIM